MAGRPVLHMSVVSDYSAVGHYRIIFPEMRMRTITSSMSFMESSVYVGDPNAYRTVRTVKIQRPCTDAQYGFLERFLKPLSDRLGFWIVMDVDDCLCHDDIPPYNVAKSAITEQATENLRKSMGLVDVITTTTAYLRDYYVRRFGIPEGKFMLIPNYLPRWWIGGSFNPNATMWHFNQDLKDGRLKVAFACGGNHYDLRNQNGGVDDFTHLVEWMRSSSKDFEFHFVGSVPRQLEDLRAEGRIKVDPAMDVLNYPREVYERHYDLWICPLQDNVFNRCKSNIKLIEAWAMGVPVLVQRCECYDRFTPDTFTDADSLDRLVSEAVRNPRSVMERVVAGRRIVDSGDNNSPKGWWLENNMDRHAQVYYAMQKTMKVDLRSAAEPPAEVQEGSDA